LRDELFPHPYQVGNEADYSRENQTWLSNSSHLRTNNPRKSGFLRSLQSAL
jgi:hypothetical protein